MLKSELMVLLAELPEDSEIKLAVGIKPNWFEMKPNWWQRFKNRNNPHRQVATLLPLMAVEQKAVATIYGIRRTVLLQSYW